MEINKKNEKLDDKSYFERFPKQIRNMNIIPCYDKPGPKQVGYKWKKYENKPFPKKELLKYEGNYALITGDPFNTGCYLIVLDIDNPIFCNYFKKEDTFTVKTPGGGYHLFYKSKKPLSNKNFLYRLPIDIRGVGGYLIIPPSSYNGKKYVVVNDHPIKIVKNIRELIENRMPLKLRKLYEEDKEKDVLKFKNSLHNDNALSLFDIIEGTYNKENEWYALNPKEEKGDIIRIKNPLRYEPNEQSFLVFKNFNKWYDVNLNEGGDALDYIKKLINDTSSRAMSYLSREYSVQKPVIEKTLDDFLN